MAAVVIYLTIVLLLTLALLIVKSVIYGLASIVSLVWTAIHFELQLGTVFERCVRLNSPHVIGTFVCLSLLCRTVWTTAKAIEVHSPDNVGFQCALALFSEFCILIRLVHLRLGSQLKSDDVWFRLINRISMLLLFTAVSFVVERWTAGSEFSSLSTVVAILFVKNVLRARSLVFLFHDNFHEAYTDRVPQATNRALWGKEFSL